MRVSWNAKKLTAVASPDIAFIYSVEASRPARRCSVNNRAANIIYVSSIEIPSAELHRAHLRAVKKAGLAGKFLKSAYTSFIYV